MLTRQLQVEQTPETAPPAYSYSSPDERRPTSSNADAMSDAKDEPDAASPVATFPLVSNDPPREELKRELSDAQANIGALREQEGLRQRKGISAAEDVPSGTEVAAATRPQGTEGVPIQVVAILCLVSFLLAYFFF